MDPYESVFNQHINNAEKKAMKDVLKKFGKEGYDLMKKFQEEGIMSIFNRRPTTLTIFYVKAVTKYVNKKK